MGETTTGGGEASAHLADPPRCILCGFDRCHFCQTGTDVEPSTFDSPVGAFRVPACWQCCENPPKLSCPEAVRLVLSHPTDDEDELDDGQGFDDEDELDDGQGAMDPPTFAGGAR